MNAEMVARGAAFAYRKYSQDYVAQEARARRAGLGIWQGAAERPAQVRAESLRQDPPGKCAIKGNISGRGRLYHLPGMGLIPRPGSIRPRASAGFAPKRRQKLPDGSAQVVDLTRIKVHERAEG